MAPSEIPVAGRRWLAPLLLVVAAALVPWTIALGWRLPAEHTSHHWDAAWVGVDVAITLTLGSTAYGVARGRPWLVIPASMAAAFLLVDAWFDNLLADSGHEHLIAALEAAFGELPLALICLWVTQNVERTALAVGAARRALARRPSGTAGRRS